MIRGVLALTLLAVAACSAVPPGRPVAATDGPSARIDTSGDPLVGAVVRFDGGASQGAVKFEWTLLAAPSGSATALDAAGPSASLFLDVAGAYDLELVVEDAQGRQQAADATVHAVWPQAPTDDPSVDQPPFAYLGGDRRVAVGSSAVLDGSGSRDPEGASLVLSFSLVRSPMGSASTLDVLGPRATLFVDRPGPYLVRLDVSDGHLGASAFATVVGVVPEDPVTADAGPDVDTTPGRAVTLDGSRSKGTDLTFAWSFLSKPAGSVSDLSASSTDHPTFVPDRAGDYEVGLQVSSGASSDTDVVRVRAAVVTSTPVPLGFAVLGSRYSRALDRLVVVSTDPYLLHVIDPATGQGPSVELPREPRAVALSPDGLRAATAHDGFVAIVDLRVPAVEATYQVPAIVGDVAFGDGYVYMTRWSDSISGLQQLELSTGKIIESAGFEARNTERLERHPTRPILYGATSGVSPDDVTYFRLEEGRVVSEGDSPYHGQYNYDGDLWLADDGSRIFTRSGATLLSSTDPQVELTYGGSLPMIGIRHLDHRGSPGTAALVLDPLYQKAYEPQVILVDGRFLEVQGQIPLPAVGGARPEGDAVFFDAQGSSLIVLLHQAGPPPGPGQTAPPSDAWLWRSALE